jgi:hypothetical protein
MCKSATADRSMNSCESTARIFNVICPFMTELAKATKYFKS